MDFRRRRRSLVKHSDSHAAIGVGPSSTDDSAEQEVHHVEMQRSSHIATIASTTPYLTMSHDLRCRKR